MVYGLWLSHRTSWLFRGCRKCFLIGGGRGLEKDMCKGKIFHSLKFHPVLSSMKHCL